MYGNSLLRRDATRRASENFRLQSIQRHVKGYAQSDRIGEDSEAFNPRGFAEPGLWGINA